MTRRTKSTRRHVEEILHGLHLYQCAIFFLNNSSLNLKLSKFLFSRFGYTNNNTKLNNIVLLHQTKTRHLLPSILFPKGDIKYYDVLYIKRTRVTTKLYAQQKKADDSNIIFRHSNRSFFGHIHSIFSIDGKNRCC